MPKYKIEKLTNEQLAQVEALASVLNKTQLAEWFGVSYDYWRSLEKRQPEIEVRYKKGKAKAIADVAKSLLMKARKGHVVAAIFYLKTQAGWKETGPSEAEDAKVVFQVHLHTDNDENRSNETSV